MKAKKQLNPTTNSAYTIKVRLGNKTGSVTVDISKPLSSFALSFALKFTAEQRLFLKINGLKLVESAATFNPTKPIDSPVIPFVDDEDIHFGTVMDVKDMKRLEKNGVYELIIVDKRDDYVKQLTEEELDEIRSHFNSMDLDRNGVLTLDEVIEYHKKEMDKNIESSKKITDRKLQTDPLHREKHLSDFAARQNFYKNTLEQNVKFFMQIDSDSNGSVSWQEFLAHASRSKVRERKQKEREAQVKNEILTQMKKEQQGKERSTSRNSKPKIRSS
jgi:Ca2+-binding EF-hand superfamily protein